MAENTVIESVCVIVDVSMVTAKTAKGSSEVREKGRAVVVQQGRFVYIVTNCSWMSC